MRTIKFRGIIKTPTDLFSGFWYGDLIHHANGAMSIRQVETGQELEVIPETVGQFTGQIDKNGVEIYEHDLINVPHNHSVREGVKVVYHHGYTYGPGHFVASSVMYLPKVVEKDMIEKIDRQAIKMDVGFLLYYGAVVIGNVHENPELIKLN